MLSVIGNTPLHLAVMLGRKGMDSVLFHYIVFKHMSDIKTIGPYSELTFINKRTHLFLIF